jgi:gamma-glutamyltranspeptidase / glutathione hydrolase
MMFQKGGNAVDAACAMLAATATMWDVLSWGGETQALIYDPRAKKVIAINGLGVAPTGATAEFYRARGLRYPPQYGPLAATTPGTPGALLVMLAEYGRCRSPTCSARRSSWRTDTRSRRRPPGSSSRGRRG